MLEKAMILVPLKALLFEMDAQSYSLLWECGTQFSPPWNTSRTCTVLPPFDSFIFRAQTYKPHSGLQRQWDMVDMVDMVGPAIRGGFSQ
jgi:hypothetical protein